MDNIGYSLFAVGVLLAANAFFVAAEFALVKIRGFQLDQAVGANRRAAVLSRRMHINLDAYLAACQLGITMASLGLGWVGEPAVAALLEPLLSKFGITGPALHTISFIVGFLLFSSLHIVVGEQVPKTYAIRKPTPVTLALAYPLHWFYLLVYPLNWLLDRANAGILRLLGVHGGTHHEVISEDEIGAIVDSSEAHGEIEQKTAELIQNAFRFDDQIVRHVMVPWADVDKLRINDSPERKESIMAKTLHSRYPVLDTADNVVGILATKDLTSAFLERKNNIWETLETRLRPPLVVPGSLLISRLLEQMRISRTHMAIVTNEDGTYIGAVTLEDMLEEIVGEIEDEWDIDTVDSPIRRTDSGWSVSGRVLLADLESEIGFAADRTPRVSTLAGFIMNRMGRMPKAGDQFVDNDFAFRVTEVDGRRVITVGINPVTSIGEMVPENGNG
jgi:CBS domain containing-hemolysin-like protein